MELLSRWFVGQPAVLALVSGLLFAGWFALRGSAPRAHLLLWASLAWAVWAVWEFAILRFSPEANIRVDLLLLIPVVLLGTLAALVAAFLGRRGGVDA